MHKSKKFSAAEKHFQKKIIELKSKIKHYEDQLSYSNKKNIELTVKTHNLEEENRQLKEWIERLLEYTELDKKDIRIACEKDKNIACAANVILSFGEKIGYFA